MRADLLDLLVHLSENRQIVLTKDTFHGDSWKLVVIQQDKNGGTGAWDEEGQSLEQVIDRVVAQVNEKAIGDAEGRWDST